jgi:hypothetical protein
MSEYPDQSERDWQADRRDFVADTRDDLADRRDGIADGRDESADERERLADLRELELDERARLQEQRVEEAADTWIEGNHESASAIGARAEGSSARRGALKDRAERAEERTATTDVRNEAARLRMAALSSTGLAMAFAEIARHLYESDDVDTVLTRITETAVATVSGCDMSSITARTGDGTFNTPVATNPKAATADLSQYDAAEGPSIDATEEAVVHAPSFPDSRWPRLGTSLMDSNVQAVVSYRLTASEPLVDTPTARSLNVYSDVLDGFDDEAQVIGFILAAHASHAIKAASEREATEQMADHLHEALMSRDVIGQAKGILMERLGISPEEAFDVLRKVSQQLNVKLRHVAKGLAESGELEPRSSEV